MASRGFRLRWVLSMVISLAALQNVNARDVHRHLLRSATLSFQNNTDPSLEVNLSTQSQLGSLTTPSSGSATSTSRTTVPIYTQGTMGNSSNSNTSFDSFPSANVSQGCNTKLCGVNVKMINVLYWPGPSPLSSCLDRIAGSIPSIDSSGNSNAFSSLTAGVEPRAEADGIVQGPDGFTYTSPSVYLIFSDVVATNECGTLGSSYATIRLGFDPAEISTMQPPKSPTDTILPWVLANFDDLQCPPPGWEPPPLPGDPPITNYVNPEPLGFYGFPWAPVISVPSEFFHYDPVWGNCGGIKAVYDPPIALTEANVLDPKTTGNAKQTPPPYSIANSAVPSVPKPSPAAKPTDAGPLRTDPPEVTPVVTQMPVQSPGKSPGQSPGQTPSQTPGQTPGQTPSQTPSQNRGQSPSQNRGQSPSQTPGQSPDQSPNQNPSQSLGQDPVQSSAENPVQTLATVSQANLGSVIMQGLGVPGTQPTAANPNLISDAGSGQQITPFATVAGVTVSLDGSGKVVVGTTTLAAGHTGITIAGTPVLLETGGLNIGGSLIPLPTPANQGIATVAGYTISRGGAGVIVDGTSISVGGPAITISGTTISLGRQGLVVGPSTIPLPPSSVSTVGGLIFTADPTGFVIDGTTLSPHGPAVTISGTVVSLGDGDVVIGTSTIMYSSIPTTSPRFPVISASFPTQTGTLSSSGILPSGTMFTSSSASNRNTSTDPQPSSPLLFEGAAEREKPVTLLIAVGFCVALTTWSFS